MEILRINGNLLIIFICILLQKEIEGLEETVTSSEFDKFLEERAAAAENLPTIQATNNLDNAQQQQQHSQQQGDKNKLKKAEEDLLLL